MRSRISRNKQMSHRWKQRPPGSNWGDFGPDDQRGRMNLVTPEKVLQGVAEVQTGMRFCLSLPLDYPGGNKVNARRRPPRRFATVRSGRANFNFLLSGENPLHTDVVADDVGMQRVLSGQQEIEISAAGADRGEAPRRPPARVDFVAAGVIQRQRQAKTHSRLHLGHTLQHFLRRDQVHAAALVVGAKIAPIRAGRALFPSVRHLFIPGYSRTHLTAEDGEESEGKQSSAPSAVHAFDATLADSCSCNWRHITLPVADLGRLSTNSTMRGYL